MKTKGVVSFHCLGWRNAYLQLVIRGQDSSRVNFTCARGQVSIIDVQVFTVQDTAGAREHPVSLNGIHNCTLGGQVFYYAKNRIKVLFRIQPSTLISHNRSNCSRPTLSS